MSSSYILFDFDGTLYAEDAQYRHYARLLGEALAPQARPLYERDLQRVAAGTHPLRPGRGYVHPGFLVRYPGAERGAWDWEGHPVTQLQSDPPVRWVGDPWWVAPTIALHHGLDPQTQDAVFLQVRRWMMSEAFAIRPVPGLRAVIDELRPRYRVWLLTNSPEVDSRAILARLGLEDAFDELRFRCRKPAGLEQALSELAAADRVISVGDNFFNDILPAVLAGREALYVSPEDEIELPPGVHRVSGPREIPAALATLAR